VESSIWLDASIVPKEDDNQDVYIGLVDIGSIARLPRELVLQNWRAIICCAMRCISLRSYELTQRPIHS
jgi:hypothetical protein